MNEISLPLLYDEIDGTWNPVKKRELKPNDIFKWWISDENSPEQKKYYIVVENKDIGLTFERYFFEEDFPRRHKKLQKPYDCMRSKRQIHKRERQSWKYS